MVWRDEALAELAAIWTQSPNRAVVTSAVQLIDTELATDPSAKGEELHEGLRRFEACPLQMLFDVQEADRLARVVKASLLRRSDA